MPWMNEFNSSYLLDSKELVLALALGQFDCEHLDHVLLDATLVVLQETRR